MTFSNCTVRCANRFGRVRCFCPRRQGPTPGSVLFYPPPPLSGSTADRASVAHRRRRPRQLLCYTDTHTQREREDRSIRRCRINTMLAGAITSVLRRHRSSDNRRSSIILLLSPTDTVDLSGRPAARPGPAVGARPVRGVDQDGHLPSLSLARFA